MRLEKKKQAVKDIRELVSESKLIIVVAFSGLTVFEAGLLRSRLRAVDSRFVVVKNSIMRHVFSSSEAKLLPLFKGNTGLACSRDELSGAKVVYNFGEEFGKISIKGGCLEGELFSKQAIEMLASLPSLDELRSSLFYLIKMNMVNLIRIIKSPLEKISRALNERKEV